MRKYTFIVLAAALTCAVIAGLAVGQDKSKTSEQPMFSPEEMAAWQKAATPGPHHKYYTELAGSWKAVCTMWMQPGAAPQTAEMKAVCEPLFGGRYGVENIEGVMMGMPFQGMSIGGYDNIKGKHTLVWIDNMSTATIYSEGTCSENCTVETHEYTQKDPMTMKDMKVKMVSRIIDKNNRVLESYTIGDDGKEFKTMEIKYTRM